MKTEHREKSIGAGLWIKYGTAARYFPAPHRLGYFILLALGLLIVGAALPYCEGANLTDLHGTLVQARFPTRGDRVRLQVQTATDLASVQLDLHRIGHQRVAGLKPGDALHLVGKQDGRLFHAWEIWRNGQLLVSRDEMARVRRWQGRSVMLVGALGLLVSWAIVEYLWRRHGARGLRGASSLA